MEDCESKSNLICYISIFLFEISIIFLKFGHQYNIMKFQEKFTLFFTKINCALDLSTWDLTSDIGLEANRFELSILYLKHIKKLLENIHLLFISNCLIQISEWLQNHGEKVSKK